MAIFWYSSRVRAINSGTPNVASCDAATRDANVSPAEDRKLYSRKNAAYATKQPSRVNSLPGKVTTGVPVHRTSILVV
jgi:hypothetical protein